MSKTMIPKQGELYYKTYDEAAMDLSDPDYKTYMSLFQIAESISTFLQVPCPDIALAPIIHEQNLYDGSISEEAAYGYHPENFPHIHNSIILFSMRLLDPTYTIGVMAHEIRHIWQKKYQPEIVKKHAQGYTDSLSNPAEIDADGFGIWFLSVNLDMSYEKAGSILCPTEKKCNPKAYTYRIEKAKEFQTIYAPQDQSKAETKNTILKEFNSLSVLGIIKIFFKKFRR